MKQEVIEIDGIKITVRELRIKDVRKAIANIKEVFDPDVDLQLFIEEKYDIIADIAKGFIVMPKGKNIDELSFSDVDELTPVFKRVNASFLDKLAMMGILPDPNQAEILSETSTTQSQDLSKEDIET